jgi:CheY-like chemotaxis protein
VDPSAPIRLLLVEDDADNRELLAELLSLDFEVETACDGQEALERFLRGSLDVIITDETLPRLRGTQLARAVKERSPHVGVVLVSGYGRVPGAEMCDAVLGKPVDVDVLTRTVRSLARPLGADSALAP